MVFTANYLKNFEREAANDFIQSADIAKSYGP